MIFGDYHVHSAYSKDSTSSIVENVFIAECKGLSEIAIAEHCLFHKYGINENQIIEIKNIIDELNKSHKLNILYSIEADLITDNGIVDLPNIYNDYFDFITLGYHKSCKKLKYLFNHLLMMRKSKKQIEKNTNSYILAMENNPKIKVLAHLNYGCKVDVKKIADVAKKKNVLIELNGKRILFSSSDIKYMIQNENKFIISSDAHQCNSVGECYRGINFAEKHNIPKSLIVNWNRTNIHNVQDSEDKSLLKYL